MHDRFQFSIRSLLMLTALVAASLAMLLWRPPVTSLSVKAAVGILLAKLVVGIVLMPPAIMASVFSKGVSKAFWIGTAATLTASAFACVTFAFSMAMVLVSRPSTPNPWNASFMMYVGALDAAPAFWCFAPINGLLSAIAYRFIWPRRGPLPIPSFRVSALLWLTVGLVIFLGGMVFERWRAAIEADEAPATATPPPGTPIQNYSTPGGWDDDSEEQMDDEEDMP